MIVLLGDLLLFCRKMIVLEDFKERVILVGVSEQDGDDAEDSLAELAELVKTAGEKF